MWSLLNCKPSKYFSTSYSIIQKKGQLPEAFPLKKSSSAHQGGTCWYTSVFLVFMGCKKLSEAQVSTATAMGSWAAVCGAACAPWHCTEQHSSALPQLLQSLSLGHSRWREGGEESRHSTFPAGFLITLLYQEVGWWIREKWESNQLKQCWKSTRC